MLEKIKTYVITHERLVSFYAIFLGFVVDSLTLPRIDIAWGNMLLFSYLLVAMTAIFLTNQNYRAKARFAATKKIAPLLPFIIQFSFGALFSGYFIFYMRSASVGASWLFILILATLLFGNDFFRSRYKKFEFQAGILFLAMFFFAIFYVPIVMKEIGVGIFILSGAVSLVAIGFFILVSTHSLGKDFLRDKKTITASIAGVYLFINILYFTNIIPPIPLSLKESGVYHDLVKLRDGSYQASSESAPWYSLKEKYFPIFERYENEPVYFFSAVFSPTDLNTRIFHEWRYFDEKKNKWVTKDTVGFGITGGRDGGYRGYTVKQYLPEGKYRVNVITERGQVLGRTTFTVVNTANKQNLEIKMLGI